MWGFTWNEIIMFVVFSVSMVLMVIFAGETTADREVKMKAKVKIEQEKTEQLRLELEILKTKENSK